MGKTEDGKERDNMIGEVFASLRSLFLKIRRLFLRNKSLTIISNNCIAGFLYHDYKMRFNSPTINLFINAYDYNRFLEYIVAKAPITDIVDITRPEDDCPQGLLNDDVRISFVHYTSFAIAKHKWLERVQRIDYDNMLVIYCQASVKEDILIDFDKLPFRNKIALVNKEFPKLVNCFVIKGFEKEEKLGYVFGRYKWYGLTYYDQVNWLGLFNSTRSA